MFKHFELFMKPYLVQTISDVSSMYSGGFFRNWPLTSGVVTGRGQLSGNLSSSVEYFWSFRNSTKHCFIHWCCSTIKIRTVLQYCFFLCFLGFSGYFYSCKHVKPTMFGMCDCRKEKQNPSLCEPARRGRERKLHSQSQGSINTSNTTLSLHPVCLLPLTHKGIQ